MTDPAHPQADDRAAAVARAASLVDREDAETRAALGRPARRRKVTVAAVWVLLALNVVCWVVFPPAALDRSDQRTPASVERDLRLSIASTAADVEEWRTANAGRLPPSLDAAGLGDRGLGYVVVDSSTFTLTGSDGADGAVRLSYRSTVPIPEFLAPRSGPRP